MLFCTQALQERVFIWAAYIQVLEIGQVGKAGGSKRQNYSFYAHSQKEAAFGDATLMIRALQQAPKHAGYSNVSNRVHSSM